MLTANYLQRLLFKWKYTILIILIIFAAAKAFSLQINRWIPQYVRSFSDLIAQETQTQISFHSVRYLFPDYLVFKNVRVLVPDQIEPVLQAPRVTLKFSFPLFSSAIPLKKIATGRMAIDLQALKKYWSIHGQRICAQFRHLPHRDIRLLVADGRLNSKDRSLPFNIDLDLNQDRISARGSWGDADQFHCTLNGSFSNFGFDADKLTVQDERSSLNLWGSWHGDNIYWKGFIFYETFYILDINGHIKLQKDDAILQQLSFSIDGDDIRLSGHCLKPGLSQCDANMTYRRALAHLDELRPLKSIRLHLHSLSTTQGSLLSGQTDIDFLVPAQAHPSLESIRLDFVHLRAQLINGNLLKLKIKQMQSRFSIGGHAYNIPLENILTSLDFSRAYRKVIDFSSRMFAGHGSCRSFLDTSSLPWQIKSQGRFEGMALYGGLLSGAFQLQSSKPLKLAGDLSLRNGRFDDTPFQTWMAAVLKMPSLDHLPGADVSCHFKVEGRSRIFEDIKLKTQDIDLSGSFDLDEDDLVSSRASIRFSKKLFGESPVGKDILGLVRGAWTLPVEFSLSGNVHRMNFQWDASPLKDQVHRHMFSFVEGMIDRRVDERPAYNVTTPSESVTP